MIAAGGTAGHVLPALAVAEALRAREALVTFAGSPDRVEAQLVPEAGYELDTFEVSGLPRRPGVAQAGRSCSRLGPRPRAVASSSAAGRTLCSARAVTSPGPWSSPPVEGAYPPR